MRSQLYNPISKTFSQTWLILTPIDRTDWDGLALHNFRLLELALAAKETPSLHNGLGRSPFTIISEIENIPPEYSQLAEYKWTLRKQPYFLVKRHIIITWRNWTRNTYIQNNKKGRIILICWFWNKVNRVKLLFYFKYQFFYQNHNTK